MDRLKEALKEQMASPSDIHHPVMFRLIEASDRIRLQQLLAGEPRVQVYDEIQEQLQELVRSMNPSIRFSKDELKEAAVAHLKGTLPEDYGVWVYYPWSFRLVHLLDEEEFALVRTDRNRNKITREEQAVLSKKKIGVVGLSVGQSVSITMALERSFGEIRLADFDILELSNLNRIRSGVHRMGSNKAINVAREIAEIDPFLKVVCYTDGLTRENIDRFFTEGGQLDILVEECDSVDIKIIARQKAKALGVPVVMDTSDRGLIDIERFDLEPDRPLLHGLIDGMDLTLVERPMTNAEKLPFLAQMVGLTTVSDRMKASLPELGRTILTWPQLATGVVLGGALVGDVCRRISLNDLNCSGRWWNDPLTLIEEETATYAEPAQPTIDRRT